MMNLSKEELEKKAIAVIESLTKEKAKYENAIEGVKLLVQELLKGQEETPAPVSDTEAK